jgi:ubiquinone/menaquinone biosynthesis C-methylase UbiE
MSSRKSGTHFKMMALSLGLRDLFVPPRKKIKETGMGEGHLVLDFGCGPGSITVAAARAVGSSGQVFALDKHPLALDSMGRKARRKHLDNIKTIQSDGRTNLPESSMDFVLLFDVFHELPSPPAVLEEIHRILKPGGRLAINDHHLSKAAIRTSVEKSALFLFDDDGRISIFFRKAA